PLAGVPAAAALEQVVFPSPQVGFISGAGGLILRTEDGGASWRLLASPTTQSLNAIFFLDLHTGVAAGDNGTVLRTRDGGLPVELAAFTARYAPREGVVYLAWRTVTESNNYGFYLERRRSGTWETIAFVAGHGTTVVPAAYAWIDRPGATSGAVQYRLRQVDLDGRSRLLRTLQVAVATAVQQLTLYQNYPNPFNTATRFTFYLPEAGPVQLLLYDAAGREAARIVDAALPAGVHSLLWNGGTLPSGLYLYCLNAAGGQRSGKLVLLK
ncbi:MAG TPA: T9SS type A sorting domain-containing protein, partial [bacterium]|nr:T9SS type A sorting domain-containing protein [bacterium]